jgi:hypothetical protein
MRISTVSNTATTIGTRNILARVNAFGKFISIYISINRQKPIYSVTV